MDSITVENTHFKLIIEDKKRFIDLLLLGDEQEDMIDKYLEQGTLFTMSYFSQTIGVCVVTRISEDILEIKNLAISPDFQNKGFGKLFIQFIIMWYITSNKIILVGTGEAPSTLNFYKSCGFIESYRIKNFFIDNYNHPIIEDGIQLIDMIYLKFILKY